MKIDLLNDNELKTCLDNLNKQEIIDIMLDLTQILKQDYESFTMELKNIPFERIRRITGYLVGTVDRFNDSKRAELDSRVKHLTKNELDSNDKSLQSHSI